MVAGLALCCSGAFVAQAATTSYIGVATQEARALAVGLYVTCYYVGGSVGAELPGFLWRWGGWPACVGLVMLVQVLTIAVTGGGWSRPGRAESSPPGLDQGVRPDAQDEL